MAWPAATALPFEHKERNANDTLLVESSRSEAPAREDTSKMTVHDLSRARKAKGAAVADLAAGDPSRVERRSPVQRLPGLLAGTGVLTQDGYRPVEELRRGDVVATQLGYEPRFAPIAWVGRRRVLGAIGRPEVDIPICLRRHAIADGVPTRDVRLAPDQAIYIEGRLYLARHLLNGASLLWDVPRVGPAYWTIQLEHHNIILADGLPVETLADPAARAAYTEVPGARLRVVSDTGG